MQDIVKLNNVNFFPKHDLKKVYFFHKKRIYINLQIVNNNSIIQTLFLMIWILCTLINTINYTFV